MDHNFSIAIDLVPLAQEKKLIPLLALTWQRITAVFI
jgi:hypothetical protein